MPSKPFRGKSFDSFAFEMCKLKKRLGRWPTSSDLQKPNVKHLHSVFRSQSEETLKRLKRWEKGFNSQEHSELLLKAKLGDERACDLFIRKNKPLIVKVVKGFSHGVLVHDDFVQQGRIALLNSIKRFKFEEGTRFSTYAYAAIKRQVAREIDDFGSMIRVPVYFHNRLGVVKAAREDFVAKNGRMPKVSELAVLTNLKEDEVRQALDVERQSNVLSIDAQFHGDDPTGDAVIAFNDFLRSSDESVEDVNMRKIDNRRLKSRLNSSLKVIGGRNGEILRLRFGMTFPNPRQNSQRKINALIKRKKGGLTLEEVGKHYGVTSERIRQLERDGLDKLRMALRKKDFL